MDDHSFKALMTSTLAGDVEPIRACIPDLADCPEVGPLSEDEFDFLAPIPHDRLPLVQRLQDPRGFNLLDLICEAVVAARARGEVPKHLSAVTLELLVCKGGMVSEAALRVLFAEKDYAAFGPFARQVQCFRRSIGLFGLAAFGFESLGQPHVLGSQSWSMRRLYGVASIIHGDALSSNITGICKLLDPAFLALLRRDELRSPFYLFVSRLASNSAMMNSILDNHAYRFLTTYLKTPSFEREVLRHAKMADPTSALEDVPFKTLIRPTVLLTDDSDTHLLKAGACLVAQGFSVIKAHGGLEALAIHRENPDIDLVVSDFGMPEMDGFNLAAQLRQRDPNLPIIINTTPPIHPDLRLEANRLGVSLIRKYDESLLLHTIWEAIAEGKDLPRSVESTP